MVLISHITRNDTTGKNGPLGGICNKNATNFLVAGRRAGRVGPDRTGPDRTPPWGTHQSSGYRNALLDNITLEMHDHICYVIVHIL